ncbi:MAG: nitroreductase family protein [Treponema sp.]
MTTSEFLGLMQKRHSCRNFDYTKPVPKTLLVDILETARLSPSACNSQPYEIFVVQGSKAAETAAAKVALFNKFIDECNTFFIITEAQYSLPAKIGAAMKNVDFKAIDIGILTANIVNAAAAAGLETCILGLFNESALQKLINRKERIRLVIAVGYPVNGYTVHEKKRKNFEQYIHFLDEDEC